jgi:hypothetical protein
MEARQDGEPGQPDGKHDETGEPDCMLASVAGASTTTSQPTRAGVASLAVGTEGRAWHPFWHPEAARSRPRQRRDDVMTAGRQR